MELTFPMLTLEVKKALEQDSIAMTYVTATGHQSYSLIRQLHVYFHIVAGVC